MDHLTIMIVDEDVEFEPSSLILTKADDFIIEAVDGREAISLLGATPKGTI